jgi:predicted DNA-binding transcriptional regulator AlpA
MSSVALPSEPRQPARTAGEFPGVVGIKQVALMLGRTEKAVRRMWEKGKMPNPVRIDSRLQWDSRDILKLIERGKSQFGEGD